LQAIVSDIHGNIEAFELVLEDIRKQNIDEIVCLGDIVGYGPNPKECVDLATGFNALLKGNHEEALCDEIESQNFNPKAKKAVDWTRNQFSMLSDDKENNAKRWDVIGSLELRFQAGDVKYVHGSPRDPVSEYIYPRDIYRPKKLEGIFEHIEWLCFVGHSHVPGVFTEDLEYKTPAELSLQYKLTDKKTIINVGSVGQPRDADPRACYAIVDDTTIYWRKLHYPFAKTIQKIQQIPELDSFLAERLREGK